MGLKGTKSDNCGHFHTKKQSRDRPQSARNGHKLPAERQILMGTNGHKTAENMPSHKIQKTCYLASRRVILHFIEKLSPKNMPLRG